MSIIGRFVLERCGVIVKQREEAGGNTFKFDDLHKKTHFLHFFLNVSNTITRYGEHVHGYTVLAM